MNFQEAVRTCLQQKYAVFTGRARRPEYWWFFLFSVLVQLVTGVLDMAIGVDIISTVASLALLSPTIGVTARRLHDLGQTGWLQVVPLGFLVLGAILLLVMPPIGGIVMVIGVLLMIGLLIYLAFPGTPGANKYGPEPVR